MREIGRELLEAAKSENAQDIADLLNAGADVNIRGRDSDNPAVIFAPLHLAAQHNSNPAIITALLEAGADVDAQDNLGSTSLHEAAWLNNNPAVTSALVETGADVEAREANSHTPLYRAARFNDNPAVIEVLLDAGADATAQDLAGKTPWDYVKDRAEFDAHWQLNEVQELATDPEDLAQAGGATWAQTLLGTIGAGFGASKDRVVHWAFTISRS